MTENQQIASTIIDQLGGHKFLAMTGANSLVAGERNVFMRLPRNLTKNRITGVRITLNYADTYDVATCVQKGSPTFEVTWPVTVGGVYADNLREVFTHLTGLDTSL